MEERRHFVCIVAGTNPDELMAKFNEGNVTEERIIYRKEDASKMKETAKSFFSMVKDSEQYKDENVKIYVDAELDATDMSDEEYFAYKTSGYKHDESGNAVTTENINGRWSTYNLGENFSIPFILKDGTSSYSALKGDVDWEKVLTRDKELYERTWDLVMEDSEPSNEQEETILRNMKRRENYLKGFGDKKTYVASNTAFWGFAFLSEDTGWMEMDETVEQFVWMTEYYNMFINPLPDDTLLTIYECKRN